MLFCRLRGLITSGVLFNSWMVFAIFGFPEFLWKVVVIHYEEEQMKYYNTYYLTGMMVPTVCYFCYYCLLVVQLFLSCFADKPLAARSRSDEKLENPCPEKCVSFISRITYWWFNGLAILGWQRTLTKEDLWSLNEEDTSDVVVKEWECRWTPRINEYMRKKHAVGDSAAVIMEKSPERVRFVDDKSDNGQQAKGSKVKKPPAGKKSAAAPAPKQPSLPSVIWCLFLCTKTKTIPAMAMKLLSDVLQFVCPMLLSALIAFVQNKNEKVWKGYFYALAMFAAAMVYTFLQNCHFHYIWNTGMHMRSMLISAVFKKSLKLSTAARKTQSVGQTVNVMSTDVQMIQDVAMFTGMIISCPLQMALSLYFLYGQLGAAIFAGLGVIVLLVPINFLLSSRQRKYQSFWKFTYRTMPNDKVLPDNVETHGIHHLVEN